MGRVSLNAYILVIHKLYLHFSLSTLFCSLITISNLYIVQRDTGLQVMSAELHLVDSTQTPVLAQEEEWVIQHESILKKSP